MSEQQVHLFVTWSDITDSTTFRTLAMECTEGTRREEGAILYVFSYSDDGATSTLQEAYTGDRWLAASPPSALFGLGCFHSGEQAASIKGSRQSTCLHDSSWLCGHAYMSLLVCGALRECVDPGVEAFRTHMNNVGEKVGKMLQVAKIPLINIICNADQVNIQWVGSRW